MDESIERGADAAQMMISEGADAAMNEYNKKVQQK